MTDAKPPLWQTLTRAGIPVGVLSLFIAWAIYAIFDRVGATSAAFLIPFVAGVALALGGILINVEWLWSGIRRRSFLAGLNAWLMAGLAVLLLAIANAIVAGTPQTDAWFLDLTQARVHTLSTQTRNIRKGLQKEVRITVAIGSGQVQAGYGGTVEVGTLLKDLAAQYRAQTRKVQVDVLDVYRDKSLADEAFARIEEKTAADSIIVECGRKSVHIPFTDLVESLPGNPFAAPSEPPSFKGEDKLSSAILNVTEDRQTAVYFLTGHGEMGIEGDEEKDLNQFVLDLKRENCRVAALNLLKTPQMPADCDLLVIAGPEKPFTDSEVEILRQYLEKDGRLFVLVHPRVPPGKLGGLDSLLADYNVDVRDDEIIIEPARDLMGRNVLSSMLIVDAYGRHPITDDVTRMNCVMDRVAPVRAATPDAPAQFGRPMGPQSDYAVTGLIYSGSNSWAEPNPTKSPLKFDPEHGEKGPLCVGVAVQRRAKSESQAAPPGEPPEKGARLVVIGSTDTASDMAFSHPEAGYEANRTLVMNCVNWLTNKETKLGIPPQKTDRRELASGPATFKAIFFIAVIGMPLAVALLGGMVWWVRRK
ncbi:MAG: GldG family protein [Candidatus Brocadiia bacterium]